MPPEITFLQHHFRLWSKAGQEPYGWQIRVFQQFLGGQFPAELAVPTGLGKTSVMAVWLAALAWQAIQNPANVRIPRRLIWVVDRRVVVDQATEEAEWLARQVEQAGPGEPARQALADLTAIATPGAPVVSVSTLRGERADNRQWSRDPTCPAIVIGTVDMVGSRLLFSGYGDGPWFRPQHAALLAQDALIVNDEAHLTPAFAALLQNLAPHAQGLKPFRWMRLTATPRPAAVDPAPAASIVQEEENTTFTRRFNATKRIHLTLCAEDEYKHLEDLARQPDRRTIVFVRQPKKAKQIAAAIRKAHPGAAVSLLTGPQRGKERDELLVRPEMQPFFSADHHDGQPHWLVATSAGEVGINLSCDRLITDLDTADHLLQRFGRLNRFGETEGDAHVLYTAKNLQKPELAATVGYLQNLDSAAPGELWAHPPPLEALSTAPNLCPIHPWLLDVWSLTSISGREWPARPQVAHWLHGETEATPPETWVAWRDDVEVLVQADPRDLREVLRIYPVLAHERVRENARDLRKSLLAPNWAERPAILIGRDGEPNAGFLPELLQKEDALDYATLLLAPGTGALDEFGMTDWTRRGLELEHYDVSTTPARRRVALQQDEPVPTSELRLRFVLEILPDESESAGEEAPRRRWAYYAGTPKPPTSQRLEWLAPHQEQVGLIAERLTRKLGLPEDLVSVFAWAARHHDLGKARPLWQHAAGQPPAAEPVAKSPTLRGRLLDGYRHELGSVLDAIHHLPADFTQQQQDLALHLIAAHHGWARPHFPDRAYDKQALRRSQEQALAATMRFGRLHRRFGPYGLAYLEALFRAADAIASQEVEERTDDA